MIKKIFFLKLKEECWSPICLDSNQELLQGKEEPFSLYPPNFPGTQEGWVSSLFLGENGRANKKIK